MKKTVAFVLIVLSLFSVGFVPPPTLTVIPAYNAAKQKEQQSKKAQNQNDVKPKEYLGCGRWKS